MATSRHHQTHSNTPNATLAATLALEPLTINVPHALHHSTSIPPTTNALLVIHHAQLAMESATITALDAHPMLSLIPLLTPAIASQDSSHPTLLESHSHALLAHNNVLNVLDLVPIPAQNALPTHISPLLVPLVTAASVMMASSPPHLLHSPARSVIHHVSLVVVSNLTIVSPARLDRN